MGRQLHIAIPGEERPEAAAHRHAIQAGVGERNRLHNQRLAFDAPLGDAEESTTERQYPVAVVAGSLREQDQHVPFKQALLDLVLVFAGLGGTALDEYGALQFRQPAEEWPARDLRFGDERTGDEAAKHFDIEIGAMIADDQQGPALGQLTLYRHADPKDSANQTVISGRQGTGQIELRSEERRGGKAPSRRS